MGKQQTSPRTNSRALALALLYAEELVGESSLEATLELVGPDFSYDAELFNSLYAGIKAQAPALDRALAPHLQKRGLDQINILDKMILRIGAYELLYTDTPKPIVISEALLLTETFSETGFSKPKRLVNAVLDKLGAE